MTLPKWQEMPFRKTVRLYGQSLCQIKKMKIMAVTILNIKKINLILRPNDEKIWVFNFYIVMTKAEIVNEIAKATGIEKITVQTVIESFMESVKGSLAKGNAVYLRGFGSFIIKHRAEKAARNITKNTTMTIPAHNIPAFKPAKVFVNVVKK